MNKNFVKSKFKKKIANIPSIKYFAFPPIGFVFKPEENVADDNTNDVNTDNTVSQNIYIFFL